MALYPVGTVPSVVVWYGITVSLKYLLTKIYSCYIIFIHLVVIQIICTPFNLSSDRKMHSLYMHSSKPSKENLHFLCIKKIRIEGSS